MRYQEGKTALIIDHVGNVHRHGLPDQDREWTLDPKPQKKQQNTVSVRQCPECFFTHEPAAVCPNCGHSYAAMEREQLREKREAELKRIIQKEHDRRLKLKVSKYSSPDECKTVHELYIMADLKGYNPHWAYHRAVERGMLRGKKGK